VNKDQVKGKAKDIGGKIQAETGKLLGDKSMQAKGLKNQVAGESQKAYGDAKEVVKKTNRSLNK
jgi:uncharacterized protein YjbJ (UPF0337 family)